METSIRGKEREWAVSRVPRMLRLGALAFPVRAMDGLFALVIVVLTFSCGVLFRRLCSLEPSATLALAVILECTLSQAQTS